MKEKIMTLLVLLGTSGSALAEGGCPQGMYPYSAGQVNTCVPIPSNDPVLTTPSEVWSDRWGAIAFDPNTPDMGLVVDHRSKRKAKKAALETCASTGAKNCQIATTFVNGCAAVATRAASWGWGTGITPERAEAKAVSSCAGSEKAACEILWSKCSRPVRVR